MKTRKHLLGQQQSCGLFAKAVKHFKQKTFISKIQTMGIDMNPTSYSKLEGQTRIATDKEICYCKAAQCFHINELFSIEIKRHRI